MQGGAAADTADQQKATAFVQALTDFDKQMNQVVVDSGLLQGISEDRLWSAGAFPLFLQSFAQLLRCEPPPNVCCLALPCLAPPCLVLPCPALRSCT